MRVLIVPDKFKGTLSAREAAEAIAAGWREHRPDDQLDLVPMSDGGDGFGPIIGELLGGEERRTETMDAAHEAITAPWWWSPSRRTAVIESANVIGLAMLPRGRHHPFELDTFGLGRLLRSAASEEIDVLIGIGGSATNDAGFGMARGLGFRFEDATGYCIERWTELDRLMGIIPPMQPVRFKRTVVACDVQNPLLGSSGASRVYGPQKGLRAEDFPTADRCFERLVDIVRRDLEIDCAAEPGTGAAGGLGFGLRAFLNGTFKPGFEIFAQAAKLDERIARTDLVVTAEGAIDQQTAMGKGTGAIAGRAREAGKPCIGLAGLLHGNADASGFLVALGAAPRVISPEESMRQPAKWLAHIAREAAALADKLG
jgi:glycerate kinase